MLILVDIGNTTVNVGVSNEDSLIKSFHIFSDTSLTADEYYLKLSSFINEYTIKAFVLSSVVPNLTTKFKELITKYYNCELIVLEQKTKTKLQIKADNPKEVGADLIANAVGVNDNDCLIVDLGTATKFIYVKDKVLQGVAIGIGVEKSLQSLVSSTALLPTIELKTPQKVLGNNTITAMQGGIIYGMAASVDGMIDRIKKEVKSDFKVIATGGLANLVIPLCEKEIAIDSELIMRGLLRIYKMNRRMD